MFFRLAVVVDEELLFFFEGGVTAGEGIDSLAGDFIELAVELRRKLEVKFIVLQEVVGGLPIAVGGHKPERKCAIAIIFENVLGFFNALAVEKDRLVVNRFDFRGEAGELFKVGCNRLLRVGFVGVKKFFEVVFF